MNTYYIIRTTNKNECGDPIYYIRKYMDEFVTAKNDREAGHFYSLDTAEKALAKIKSDGGPKGLRCPHYQWEICPVYDKRGVHYTDEDLIAENQKLKEKLEKLKQQHYTACDDIGRLATENRKLKKELKMKSLLNVELHKDVIYFKRRTTTLQRQFEEADADRLEAQTKLALQKAEFQVHWFDLACIDHVIFNDPATIVFWKDGTKTVVKNSDKKKFDPEKGLAMAICKKLGGNKGSYYDAFKKWLPKK